MNLESRITAFVQLGEYLTALSGDALTDLSSKVTQENPWFTRDQVAVALRGVSKLLDMKKLKGWIASYDLNAIHQKTIGVAMAGNIPMVGFHDFLCVLISGHRLKAKLSSKDSVLMRYLSQRLIEIEPAFGDAIQFSERLLEIDAMIATGSDNTARYFEYYFRNIPHIIRKNRSSCAVILGEESDTELNHLGADVFTYYGLGCRSISKIYAPEKYDLTKLFNPWDKYIATIHHHKYFNNYEYQKSILLVNKVPFFDNGFILLKEDAALVSPISVLFFEWYADQEDLRQKIAHQAEKTQCIVSAQKWFAGSEDFGQAQFPAVSDYSDKVDTLTFLAGV